MKNRSFLLTLCAAVVLPMLMSGCGSSGNTIGERAFVEAVNLKCRSDKARFALAKRVAGDLAETSRGQDLQADAQKRLDELGAGWEDLRGTVATLRGPKPVEEAIGKAVVAFKSLPGEVAKKTLTPAEAKEKLESIRADLRRKGFVDCV